MPDLAVCVCMLFSNESIALSLVMWLSVLTQQHINKWGLCHSTEAWPEPIDWAC